MQNFVRKVSAAQYFAPRTRNPSGAPFQSAEPWQTIYAGSPLFSPLNHCFCHGSKKIPRDVFQTGRSPLKVHIIQLLLLTQHMGMQRMLRTRRAWQTLRLSCPSSHLSLCLVLLVEHVEVREGMRAVIAWLLGEVGHYFRIALVTAAIYRAHQVVERLASNFQI